MLTRHGLRLIAMLALLAAWPPGAAAPARAAVGTPLPNGRAYAVAAVMGGSYNRYWVRLAEYTFTAAPGSHGTIRERYWSWDETRFAGNAAVNKVPTGFTTRGCAATCSIRTPTGFEPKHGPKGTLTGRYRFDRFGRLVVEWPGGHVEAWTVRNEGRRTHLSLHHSNYGALFADGYSSRTPLTTGATRAQVAAASLTGVQHMAAYGDRIGPPVKTSPWPTNVMAAQRACGPVGSACLFYTGPKWRSGFAIPTGLGRRAYWQNQVQGDDGDTGACFGPGGGHTVALLQILDDDGRFAGFVGAEASFNGRFIRNAIVSELRLTTPG